MQALAALVRSKARQTRVNGVLCLTSNGEPALVAAFAELGWPDPCPLDRCVVVSPPDAAVVVAPERAVMDKPKGRIV